MNSTNPVSFRRRHFLASTVLAAATLGLRSSAAEPRQYRAAIIGRTGGGDYGHGFDTVFQGFDQISVEALADANEAGRKGAAARARAKRQYADYREMLEKEKPDIVSIAPRHPDCHRDMALASLAVGAHLILEKPMTEHLNDADEIVGMANKTGRKIVVGHKNRFTSDFIRMQRQIQEGFFGTILEMRVQGKQDTRAGGEDLIVLGTHDFDTMRFFFGDPQWCFGSVTADGHPITRGDVRKGREPILVAGDTIRAQFHFPNRVMCTWQSVKAEPEWHKAPPHTERWGFTIFGTKRILSYYSGSGPQYWDTPFLGHKTQKSEWKPLPDPANWPPKPVETNLVTSLLRAIENDGQPSCNAVDGRWTIEMVAAIYESQRTKAPVTFPLNERGNPLLRL